MGDGSLNQQPEIRQPEPANRGFMIRIFTDNKGLRSGWRFLLYALAVFLLVWVSQIVLRALLGHRTPVETPIRLIASEIVLLVAAMLPAWVASRLEERPWRTYGLPLRPEGALFATGLFAGFAAISLLMLLIHLFHGVYLGNVVLHGTALLRYALVWGVGFLLVGIAEEFLFRGYSLYTLATGIGFWPAAVLLSTFFGAIHLRNIGEDWIGALGTIAIALVFAFSLWRTGSLWFAVGLHASWDWAESFFLRSSGQWLQSSWDAASLRDLQDRNGSPAAALVRKAAFLPSSSSSQWH